ncbi:nitrite reductase small subunit NirD [Nocardioides nanhaiensis]|uniref:Nitrite reductase small subunit NirD n=1 Tax=Nocardioides nanhaiensis TaxID=1476871 RepID=A0ABP8VT33_9ACTN
MTAQPTTQPTTDGTTVVCRLAQVPREGGVTALVRGEAVAVFRTRDDGLFALGNYDPIGRASVLARGLLGSTEVEGELVPYVASPLHKQRYDLRTGRCLDDPAVRVPTWRVHVTGDGEVVVGERRE